MFNNGKLDFDKVIDMIKIFYWSWGSAAGSESSHTFVAWCLNPLCCLQSLGKLLQLFFCFVMRVGRSFHYMVCCLKICLGAPVMFSLMLSYLTINTLPFCCVLGVVSLGWMWTS